MSRKIISLREKLYLLQDSKCFYCGNPIPEQERTFEHIVPSSAGGTGDVNNGVVICLAANQLLGNISPKQKIIMMKAGCGRIQCPKKALSINNHS